MRFKCDDKTAYNTVSGFPVLPGSVESTS